MRFRGSLALVRLLLAGLLLDGVQSKSQLAGGLTVKNPHERKYAELAREALAKYAGDEGLGAPLAVLRVLAASEQVVAGTMTRLDFEAAPSSCASASAACTPDASRLLVCRARLFVQVWNAVRELAVTCRGAASTVG